MIKTNKFNKGFTPTPFKKKGVSSQSERGFTLIELLVVIAIIGVLASVVLTSLNSARGKARDAKRLSELRQLMIATEFFYDDNNAYPSAGSSYVYRITGLTPTYISVLPEDPTRTGGSRYRYWYSNRALGYTLLVKLEKNGNSWCKIIIGTSGYSGWNGYANCF